MPRKRKVCFWVEFESFLKKSFPEYIIKILYATGYDNEIAISALCNEDIKIIEEFVDSNLKHLIENLDIYNSSEKFIFLPGHKKLVLSLPKQLKEFENNKKEKVEKSETEQLAVTDEEIELLSETEIVDLKKKLLSKLTTSAENIGLQKFTENEFLSSVDAYVSHSLVKNKKPTYKCLIKCIKCEKRIPCTWNGYWQIGNFEKHLKIHMKTDDSSEQLLSSNSNSDTHSAENKNSKNENNNKNNSSKEMNSNYNNDRADKELDEVLGLQQN